MLRCATIQLRARALRSIGYRYVSSSTDTPPTDTKPTKTHPKLPPKSSIISKFNFPKNTHTVQEIDEDLSNFWGREVILSGWIDKKPKKIGKEIAFATLRDLEGNFTQIITTSSELASQLTSSHVEDCVTIKGKIQKRHSRSEHEGVRWDLSIKHMTLLNSSDILASQLYSLKKSPDSFPQQHRYLQLRLPFFQNALKTRAKASQIIRDNLNKLLFTEVETPLLFKSTPEGAREFLVPTRKNSAFYALPQSPQQYKQLLMASGVTNYYQFAKCFRDEDLRADRQPEFTQVDLEMSFANAKDVQKVVESSVKRVWEEAGSEKILTLGENGKAVDGDFIRLKYDEVLSKYGIDKPDLTSTLEIQDLSEFATAIEHKDFPVFEACVLKEVFKKGTKVKLPTSLFDKSEYRNRNPIVIPIKTKDDFENWYKKIKPIAQIHDLGSLKQKLDLQIGDVVAFSTRSKLSYENPTPLGRFRQLVISEFPHTWKIQSSRFIGAWIEDFPLFTPSEKSTSKKTPYPIYDFEKLESTHHPFTMVKPEDYEYLETNPLLARGEHYDLVLNGVELGGGSRRVHDADIQRYIFTEILKIQNPDKLFGHLLKALSLGCPPHAGFAIGFDRLCAMLIGSSSIRDVIAFPKTQNGVDPVVESPTDVSKDVLEQYHISKIPEKA